MAGEESEADAAVCVYVCVRILCDPTRPRQIWKSDALLFQTWGGGNGVREQVRAVLRGRAEEQTAC